LFLHVFNWPLGKKLNFTGISENPKKIYVLSDKQKSPLQFSHSGPFIEIQLPDLQPDTYISVIVIEFKQKPMITNDLVAKTNDGGYSLTPKLINPKDESVFISRKERGGTIPEYVDVQTEKTLKWKIYIDNPGEKTIDISYSYENKSEKNKLILKAAGSQLSQKILPTGKTVGEPNQNWVIDNFKSHRVGKINFSEKGLYDIELDIIPVDNDIMKFQWIWIY
jgi:alpha-L-fucosidase